MTFSDEDKILIKSARTEEKIDLVDDLIVSQEDKPQTHRTVREIASETGIPRSSVMRIIKKKRIWGWKVSNDDVLTIWLIRTVLLVWRGYIHFGPGSLRSSVTSVLFWGPNWPRTEVTEDRSGWVTSVPRTELHTRRTDLHLVILNAQCFEIDDSGCDWLESFTENSQLNKHSVRLFISTLCLKKNKTLNSCP